MQVFNNLEALVGVGRFFKVFSDIRLRRCNGMRAFGHPASSFQSLYLDSPYFVSYGKNLIIVTY